MKRNLQRSLAFKIQKLSNTFRGQQKEYLGKLRAQKEGALGQVSAEGWRGLCGLTCGRPALTDRPSSEKYYRSSSRS